MAVAPARRPRGAVTAASRHAVKLDGTTYVYEVTIPKEELAQRALKPGATRGMILRAGNNQGPYVDLGSARAVTKITKINGLTLHTSWERSVDCGLRWRLVE